MSITDGKFNLFDMDDSIVIFDHVSFLFLFGMYLLIIHDYVNISQVASLRN